VAAITEDSTAAAATTAAAGVRGAFATGSRLGTSAATTAAAGAASTAVPGSGWRRTDRAFRRQQAPKQKAKYK
jgi:hypothetical protein